MSERKPLALIPARGGSKRFPRKNIASLAGRPLLAWSIAPALESGLFDRVYVSSEDAEILAAAAACGGTPMLRPTALAGDKVALEPVCRDALERLALQGEHYTDIVVLLPTSPFRDPARLVAAWEEHLRRDADALVSICPYPHPPQWALRIDAQGLLLPFDQKGYDSERQDLELHYRHDGAYFISRVAAFLETGYLLGSRAVPFRSAKRESVDIDDAMDLAWAEFLQEKKG